MISRAAYGLWLLSLFPSWREFQRASRDPRKRQEQILLRILRENAETEIGKRFEFSRIRSISQFQSSVPIHIPADYESDIKRMQAGEKDVLVRGAVGLFQPTSGTTGGRKLIPYTAALQAEFQNGLNPWLFDLYRSSPSLLDGKAFWQISPLESSLSRAESGEQTIGFQDDAEYLSPLTRVLWRQISAVPSGLQEVRDGELFLHLLSLFLLQAEDLRLISVWSPTFLLRLLEFIRLQREVILLDLKNGTIRGKGAASANLPRFLRLPKVRPRRREELERLLKEERPFQKVWPKLSLLSMWTEGFACRFVSAIQREFPAARIQTKGLIATEGIVSLPLASLQGRRVPAINSHFLEFESVQDGTIRLLDELREGESYRVLFTTGGGLYRYRLGDTLRVVEHAGLLPVLSLLGREGGVSDLFGEKLHESHVTEAITEALQASGIVSDLFFLAPEQTTSGFRYSCALKAEGLSEETGERFRLLLEELLQKNPHYEYCRKLGQLEPLTLSILDERAFETYLQRARGTQPASGGEKPGVLLTAFPPARSTPPILSTSV